MTVLSAYGYYVSILRRFQSFELLEQLTSCVCFCFLQVILPYKLIQSSRMSRVLVYDSEHLRCAICTEYLSCAPIQVLRDGKNVCGNCIPPESEAPGYRNLTLEVMLSKHMFACKYKDNGCPKNLIFGVTRNHQATCGLRPFSCLAGECLWTGPIRLFLPHFTDNHPDQILPKAEFKLEGAVNKEEIVMVAEGDINFLFKYSYKAATRELVYDIRHFKSVKEASCKIRVLNNSETVPCLPYRFDFGNPQVSKTLILSNLEADEIIVEIDFSFIPYNLLRCGKCKNYLAIPIVDSEGEHICSNCCNQNSTPTTNEDVVQRVANSLIPCRWYNCETVARGHEIREHEMTCNKRIYRCIVPDCSDFFIRREMWSSHIIPLHKNCIQFNSIHKVKIIPEGNYFYTATKSGTVFLELKAASDTNEHPQLTQFKMKTTEYANNSIITFKFKHFIANCVYHCELTKEINLKDENQIATDFLPECFKEGYLLIVVPF